MSIFENRRMRQSIQVAQDFISSFLVTSVFLSILNAFPQVSHIYSFALVISIGRVSGNYILGSYRALWRYTSYKEIQSLALNSFIQCSVLTVVILGGLVTLPYYFAILDALFFFAITSLLRGVRRLQVNLRHQGSDSSSNKNVLILGAGDTSNLLLQDLKKKGEGHSVVGILDDDSSKHNASLQGVKIIGSTTKLETYIQELNVKHVIIALEADNVIIHDLVSRARRARVSVKVAPSLSGLLMGDMRGHHYPYRVNDISGSKEMEDSYLASLDKSRDKRILVTGGAGYIGSHLLQFLLDNGYYVRVLDNFLYGRKGIEKFEGNPNLEIVEGDISNIRDVVRCVKDVDTVIALAALVGDPACGINAEETLNLNYESTKILVESANFYGVRRFVFASSCSVYGASDDTLLTEESSLNPVSLYARTRIMSEEAILERCGSMEPVILRLSTVFGLSDRMRFDLVVNTLSVRGIVNKAFQVFGGGQWRPFVHCKDVAKAFFLAATAESKQIKPVVFNVGSTEMNYTITEIAKIVESKLPGVKAEYDDHIDDPRNYKVNFDRIKTYLGFEPEYTIEKGVEEMITAITSDDTLKEFTNPVYSNVQVLKSLLSTEVR